MNLFIKVQFLIYIRPMGGHDLWISFAYFSIAEGKQIIVGIYLIGIFFYNERMMVIHGGKLDMLKERFVNLKNGLNFVIKLLYAQENSTLIKYIYGLNEIYGITYNNIRWYTFPVIWKRILPDRARSLRWYALSKFLWQTYGNHLDWTINLNQ